jgi:aryl-alcohol dehydrogenase (NADP+)
VSPICLGAMTFGKETSAPVAQKIVGKARDAGVNFIDTAESYVMGESEKIVGKLIKKDRPDWIVATKLGSKAIGDGPNQKGLSRAWMIDGLNGSLKRLGMDYVDIYYLHRADPTAPLRETIETMGELIRAGKVRYWGFSNFRAWKIAVPGTGRAETGDRATVLQCDLSIAGNGISASLSGIRYRRRPLQPVGAGCADW